MPEQITRSRTQARRACVLLAAALLAVATGAMSLPALAQQVVVVVNGSPITSYDIEQRSKFIKLSTQKTPSRQEVLDELIDEKIKVHEASLYSMDAKDSDVNRGIANMASRSGLSVAQFTQVLAGQGVALNTIKARMRADFAWNQLVRARFPATLQIEESEIRDVLAKKGESEIVAYDYTLRPIIFIVPKGSPSSFVDGRMREAEALRSRFNNCNDGISFARALKDVAVRDLVRRTSADLPNELRDILNAMPVGQLTKPEITGQGVQVFALCERIENKTDTPQKRNIRQ
ncbi:MAG: peptidylprolyl isomerase, partial [Xanthobacteraceae bacterium]